MLLTRAVFVAVDAAGLAPGVPRPGRAAAVDTLGLDYACYNPPSLILKQNGWLEAALEKSGTKVNWVLSLG